MASSVRHKLALGDPVRLTNSGGALPAGTASTIAYFAIPDATDKTKLKLASTRANAFAGTAVDATGAGTGTHTIHRMGTEVFVDCSMVDTDERYVETVVAKSEWVRAVDLDAGGTADTDRPTDTTTAVRLATAGAGETALTGVKRGDVVTRVINITDLAIIAPATTALDIPAADVFVVNGTALAATKNLLIYVRPFQAAA
jgi:hypothetical protein